VQIVFKDIYINSSSARVKVSRQNYLYFPHLLQEDKQIIFFVVVVVVVRY
jgi:hypothetical protein